MPSVAIIGAGPGGLVAARYLQQEGFTPTIFDQNATLGGQWSATPGTSGVWPAMRTNTSRIMTSFSDLPHPPGTAVYPTNQQMHAYLERYAAKFNLTPAIHLNTRVEEISRNPSSEGWRIRTNPKDGATTDQIFSHVVIASGRYNKPSIPAIPGLDTFTGKGGIAHTFDYKHPEATAASACSSAAVPSAPSKSPATSPCSEPQRLSPPTAKCATSSSSS